MNGNRSILRILPISARIHSPPQTHFLLSPLFPLSLPLQFFSLSPSPIFSLPLRLFLSHSFSTPFSPSWKKKNRSIKYKRLVEKAINQNFIVIASFDASTQIKDATFPDFFTNSRISVSWGNFSSLPLLDFTLIVTV